MIRIWNHPIHVVPWLHCEQKIQPKEKNTLLLILAIAYLFFLSLQTYFLFPFRSSMWHTKAMLEINWLAGISESSMPLAKRLP